MSEDFTQSVDRFEQGVRQIASPKLVLNAICQTALERVDFICILKLGEDEARPWMGTSREDLAAETLEALVLRDEDVPALRVVRRTRIPMSMAALDVGSLASFWASRGTSPRPCTLFPLSIGDRLPFVVFMDGEKPLSAPEVGLLTRVLMAASAQFARLIAREQKRETGTTTRPDAPRITRLMGLNWASEYHRDPPDDPSESS